MKCVTTFDEKQLEEIASVFSALSSPKRIQIIELVGKKPMSVTEIAEKMGCRPPCVSQHLNILKSSGIVTAKRAGHEVAYSLQMSCVSDFINCLLGKRCHCED